MSRYILTSMFQDELNNEIAEIFRQLITNRRKFAFVASEFEQMYEKTDNYLRFFLDMFRNADICFDNAYVVDGRMTPQEAQKAVAEAGVIWLSGGNTVSQFNSLKKYGLEEVIRTHGGVVIGMSAGTINLAKTAIRTKTCGHPNQEIYEGIGCVDITVEPHFSMDKDLSELLELSCKYEIYGLCDNAVIVCIDNNLEFYGEVYRIFNGQVERVSH